MLKSITGLLLFLAVQSTWAQNPYFLNYDTETGLPSSEVYDVAFGPDGKVWFSTDRGLCSNDSYGFDIYTNKEGLTNNSVLEIKEGPNGELWFLNLDGSINCLVDDSISAFSGNDSLAKFGFQDRWILGLGWDRKDRMVLWQPHHKLRKDSYYRWEEYSKTWENLSFDQLAREYPVRSAHNFRVLGLGNGYVPEIDLKELILIPNDGYLSVSLAAPRTVYYGQLDQPFQVDSITFPTDVIDVMAEGEDLWIGTNSGLFRYRLPDIHHPIGSYFQNLPISSINKDSEENYWITTLNKGVLMVPSFDVHQPSYEDQESNEQTILTIAPLEDHLIVTNIKGDIWAIDSSFAGQVLVQDKSQFSSFNHATQVESGVLHYPFLIRENPNGLSVQQKEFSFHSNFICEWEPGIFLCLGYTQYRWLDTLSGNIPHVAAYRSGPGRILSTLKTSRELLLGTVRGVLAVEGELDSQTDQSNTLQTKPKYPLIPSLQGRINHMVTDSQDRLFVGTMGAGLVIIQGDSSVVIGESQGLSSNMINHLRLENDSILWIATNKGLDRLRFTASPQPKILGLQHLNSLDGLPSNFIRDVVIWKGLVWLATNKGLVYFDPEQIFQRALPRPQIRLESIRVNHNQVSASDSPVFKSTENDLAFDFQAVSFRKPVGVPFYRFRLLGHDSAWNYTSNRSIQYPGLPPGTYDFEVVAQNRFGSWSEEAAHFSFEIHPHFSQTWWFNSLVGLLVVALIGGLLLIRYRRIRIREIQEQTLQKAQLRTKEAELAALRNQMNPHFVFNALNSIQSFIFRKDVPRASYYLGRFAQLMRNGLEFSRSRLITLEEELNFLKSYLELESIRFPDRFSYSIQMDEQIYPRKIMLPPFLFQPILENALKHAFKGLQYPGKLELSFEMVDDRVLQIFIRDNGCGLDVQPQSKLKALHTSRGLEIVQNQMDLIGNGQQPASFLLRNRENHPGTEAIFVIPV